MDKCGCTVGSGGCSCASEALRIDIRGSSEGAAEDRPPQSSPLGGEESGRSVGSAVQLILVPPSQEHAPSSQSSTQAPSELLSCLSRNAATAAERGLPALGAPPSLRADSPWATSTPGFAATHAHCGPLRSASLSVSAAAQLAEPTRISPLSEGDASTRSRDPSMLPVVDDLHEPAGREGLAPTRSFSRRRQINIEGGPGVLLWPGLSLRMGPRSQLTGPIDGLAGSRSSLQQLLRPSRCTRLPHTGIPVSPPRSVAPGLLNGSSLLSPSIPNYPAPEATSSIAETCSEKVIFTNDVDSSSWWILGYRTVRFRVSQEWLRDHLADWSHIGSSPTASYGMVSSVSETLDALWPTFRNAARGEMETFYKLQGCYNLGRSETAKDYVFFMSGWGAPHKLYLYTMQMIYTYIHFADYPLGSFECQGFHKFMEILLMGERATQNKDEDPKTCSLAMNFVNKNQGDGYRVFDACMANKDCDYKVGNKSVAWDSWESLWLEERGCFTGDPSDTSTCRGAPHSSSASATGGRFNVNLHPVELAFDGWLIDQIMFYARMARDFGLYLLHTLKSTDGLAYLSAAKCIARYALRLMARWGQLIIHELGHVYLGSGHCKHNCCFDVAADSWWCKVLGKLGLPAYSYQPFGGNDYSQESAVQYDLEDGCGRESAYTSWICDVKDVGAAGQDSDFCSTGCTKS